jgi:hypothetical protein
MLRLYIWQPQLYSKSPREIAGKEKQAPQGKIIEPRPQGLGENLGNVTSPVGAAQILPLCRRPARSKAERTKKRGTSVATAITSLLRETMDYDQDKIDEVVLALLYLTLHDEVRAWKGHDWDALNRMPGITSPTPQLRRIVLTEEDIERSKHLSTNILIGPDIGAFVGGLQTARNQNKDHLVSISGGSTPSSSESESKAGQSM